MVQPRLLGIVVAVMLGAALLMISGCATFQNTPQQEAVWGAYHACQAEQRVPGNIQMTRVEPDGRYWCQWASSPYGAEGFRQCITEKVRAAR